MYLLLTNCLRLNIVYFSLGMQSNDTEDEAAAVLLFGLIKIERSRLVLLCSPDTIDLPENINCDY